MRRGRWVAAALALATVVVGQQQASAAIVIPVRVSVNQYSHGMITGDAALDVRGTVTPTRKGGPVALQEKRSGVWRSVRSGVVDGHGRYRLVWSPPSGRHELRVLRASDGARRSGTSRVFVVTAYSCPRMAAPTDGAGSWFQAPTAGVSPLTTNISKLFCSAARGSQIDIAMYFFFPGRDTAPIVRALTLVHRYRGVKVRLLLEGAPFAGGANASALKQLRAFADVRTCLNGCRSAVPGQGIVHDKLVTISDTTWWRSVDPVVLSSSANWSSSQLHAFWQSAQLLHNDARLTREMQIRFENLRACATSAGCASWRPAFRGQALDTHVYQQRSTDRVWVDPNTVFRSGSAGRGSAVTFGPRTADADPFLAELARYSCTPTHRSVRLAVFNMSYVRSRQVAKALALLRTRGCDVRVVLSTPSKAAAEQADLRALLDQRLTTTCVAHVHDKFILIDAVGLTDPRPRKVILAGSDNLTATSLLLNDENSLRLTTLGASTTAARATARMYSSYLAQWVRMTQHSQRCTG